MNEKGSYDMNGIVYYDYWDGTWKLMNDNYHQMVIMSVKLVKTFSPLYIEAPEWHSMGKRAEKLKETDRGDEVPNNGRIKEDNKHEREWITPKDTIRVLNEENCKLNDIHCCNSYNVLSDNESVDQDEDDEDDEDDDYVREKSKRPCRLTRELLLHMT